MVPKRQYITNQNIYSDFSKGRISFCPADKAYCYKIDQFPSPNSYSTWFCSKECAVEKCKQFNVIMFFYDETLNSVAMLVPHQKIINQEYGNTHLIAFRIPGFPEQRWYQQPSNYKDLTMFGFDTSFPEIRISGINLVESNLKDMPKLKAMFADPNFCKMYFGSDHPDVLKRMTLESDQDYLKECREKFGRRGEIQWFIEDDSGSFLGYLHLTQFYQPLPGKWVMEFGIVPQYQGQGIMSKVLPAVVKWAKSEGCDEIFAISEEYNHACHKLLKKIPYTVEESIHPMTDQWAGRRLMKIYDIIL